MHSKLKEFDDQIKRIEERRRFFYEQLQKVSTERYKFAADLIAKSCFLNNTVWRLDLYFTTRNCVRLTLWQGSKELDEVIDMQDDSHSQRVYIEDNVELQYSNLSANIWFNNYAAMVKFVKKHKMRIDGQSISDLKKAIVSAQELLDAQETK